MSDYILPFEKFQGLGNDFIIIHHNHLPAGIDERKLAKAICQRRWSIGADGLIIVKENPRDKSADLEWEYINSDGTYGEMCGNGIRCFSKYVFDRGLIDKENFTIKTRAGKIKCQIMPNDLVLVNMGEPVFLAREVPVAVKDFPVIINYPIKVLDREFLFTAVSMGNPHAVIFLDDEKDFLNLDLARYGQVIEHLELFPNRTNVEFAFMKNRKEILVKVWERGCGITLACGTGACATVVAAKMKQLIQHNDTVDVSLPGGRLRIFWNKDGDNNVFMTGPARSVFVGQISIVLDEEAVNM